MSYPSDWEKGASYTDGAGNYMEEPVPPRLEPMLSREQQAELSRAATEALANLAMVSGPIMAQFQALVTAAIPVMRASMEPFFAALRDAGLDATTAVEEMRRLRAEGTDEQA